MASKRPRFTARSMWATSSNNIVPPQSHTPLNAPPQHQPSETPQSLPPQSQTTPDAPLDPHPSFAPTSRPTQSQTSLNAPSQHHQTAAPQCLPLQSQTSPDAPPGPHPSPTTLRIPPQECGPGSSVQPNRARKVRGVAKPYHTWGTGEKLPIQFNEFFVPVGPWRKKFQSQLGFLAKKGEMLPLTYTDWRAPEPELKQKQEEMWEHIKSNANVVEEYKEICLRDTGRKCSNWKHELKRDYYDPYKDDPEMLAMCPPRVTPEQWPILVSYFAGEEGQAKSSRNKENRSHQLSIHRSGRKGHMQVREELKNLGQEFDRPAVYMKTYSRSDPIAAENIEKLNDQLVPPEDCEIPTNEFRESAFLNVMGPDNRGRMRTMGIGLCSSKVFGKRKANVSLEIVNMRERLREELRQELRDEFREELRQELHQELRHEMREEMEALLQARLGNNVIKETTARQGAPATHVVEQPNVNLGENVREEALTTNGVSQSPATHVVQQSDVHSSSSACRPTNGVQNQRKPPLIPLVIYSMASSREPVAKGFFVSQIAERVVHGITLGKEYYEVYIREVLKP